MHRKWSLGEVVQGVDRLLAVGGSYSWQSGRFLQKRKGKAAISGISQVAADERGRADILTIHVDFRGHFDLRACDFESEQRDERLCFEAELKGRAVLVLDPIGIVSAASGAVTVPKPPRLLRPS